MSDARQDRLYELLPAVYRQLDAEQQEQLRDFLRVVAEQVNIVEDDILRLYDNWFAETCDEWVIPYIGDLIGYQPVHAAGAMTAGRTDEQRLRNRILAPRRELADTIRNRSRRGTLALLELLASDTAGLPARAVEFFERLAVAQSLNFVRTDRGLTADLRNADALDQIDGPFDSFAHTIDIRRATSQLTPGRYNIPSAADFIWRIRSWPLTRALAYADQGSSVHYTFSPIGNDAPLFIAPRRESDPSAIAGELEVPAPIRRRALERKPSAFYGADRSFVIWKDDDAVPLEQIVAADLSDWTYTVPNDRVAVDPVLGRIAFPDDQQPEKHVWVSWHYGFTSGIGGGEYRRPILQADGAALYRVGAREPFKELDEAIWQWNEDPHRRAVIEIADSNTYTTPVVVHLSEGRYLQIRAASGSRPLIRLTDSEPGAPEAANVTMAAGSRFVLDGVVLAGRPLAIQNEKGAEGDVRVAIRHCTLVPGWLVFDHCKMPPGGLPSISLDSIRGRVTIDSSIIGAIRMATRSLDGQLRLELRDSIVDALSDDGFAIAAKHGAYANARLTIVRSTIIGEIRADAMDLAENSIFTGEVTIVRRQHGCVRFSYVPFPSRTPRRFHCQPDLVERQLIENAPPLPTDEQLDAARERVSPIFDSVRYGRPDYCRLAPECPVEITRGADDESEMGVFHDVFAPQRQDNLRQRLDEYTPSRMDTGIFFAD